MCLYPKLISNPKYKSTKKNGGFIPPVFDERVKYVPIKCNNCIECRKQISRDWQVRLQEEIKHNTNGVFVTLTFSNESINEISEMQKNFIDPKSGIKYKSKIDNLDGYDKDNIIATKAVRLFLERWRKKTKKSVRHWLVTELGHEGTENIHLHGIIWTNQKELIKEIWNYGWVWDGTKDGTNYVTSQTVNYIIKYITKIDDKHYKYKPVILTSPGIGGQYIGTFNASKNNYAGDKTNEAYRTSTGHKISLPIYYRNKIYTEHERELLWIDKLNKETRYVMGEKVDISKSLKAYDELVKYYRRKNAQHNYGNDSLDQNKLEYARQQRQIMHATRQAKTKKNTNTGL